MYMYMYMYTCTCSLLRHEMKWSRNQEYAHARKNTIVTFFAWKLIHSLTSNMMAEILVEYINILGTSMDCFTS